MVNIHTMEVTEDLIKEVTIDLIRELPFLEYIVRECGGRIYGGFMRWIVEFICEHDRKPTVTDAYKYLKNGDVDIAIRRHIKNLRTFLQRVAEQKGYIEFSCSHYSGKVEDIRPEKISPDMGFYRGGYLIWIPIDNNKDEDSRFIRYEILLEDAPGAFQDTDDFTVNMITFGYGFSYKTKVKDYWVKTDVRRCKNIIKPPI